MELRCLQTLNIPATALAEKPFLCGQPITLIQTSTKRGPNSNNLNPLRFRTQISAKISSLEPQGTAKDVKSKDANLVFVAGATGRVGSRTVRELLKSGFKVRAGVRSAQRAQPLVKSVEQIKLENATDGGAKAIEKLEIVECDLEKSYQIRPALGDASIVICCIGASEKEIFDVTGPYRIDYLATKNLIDAATVAKVDHFILLTSLGTNKVGFPAAILNLFWGVLLWKRKAEEALLASGLPYTIVRPGGMERPTDSFKETHNITLSEEDTLFGGLVSNLQVAELMAVMAKNRSLSYCKVVEVVAETTAPLIPMEDLLAKIPPQRVEVSPPKKSATPTSITSEIPDASLEKKPSETKLKAAAPLSPYTAYAELKPPTSPSPIPPGGHQAGASGAEDSKPTKEASSVVDYAFDKAELLTTRPSSPYAAYEDLKPPTSPSPNPPGGRQEGSSGAEDSEPTKAVSSVVDSTFDKAELLTTRPLSPYTAYEDLKPPTSPIPIPPGGRQEGASGAEDSEPTKAASSVVDSTFDKAELLTTRPLSPYTAYEDLKPPTSPIPIPPGGRQEGASGAEDSEHTKAASSVVDSTFDKAELLTTSYEDLKPPTSPSTNPPGGRQEGASGAENSKPTKEASSVYLFTFDKAELLTTRPLSPYTAYEDLKPPTSPSPRPSGLKSSATVEVTSAVTGGNDVAIDSANNFSKEDSSKSSAFCHSPYPAYEDFKPPSSPTPSFNKM
ncbi:protein TIC 62, chloroplastic isoform X2 [Solanum pennellii]|uniref:Protein TIC 62, chloroplastic isoform X2 n=1 Tax=Solanum pennellii TaxID=28526 RepID=A0ABM1HSN5_SOLPN|nr:protein TIC 62, chloroplastic isoform X2 [Solanum pennellii]